MSTKFAPTPSELAIVSQIFAQADPQKLGILTGDVAVKVFGGAKLPPEVLGEIWSIADEDNNGWLPRKGVAVAIRLMGWAQKGGKVSKDWVNKPGPLPTIDGVTPLVQQNTGISLPKSPPPSLPPWTAQERAKFQSLFVKAGPGPDGLLSAAKARDIFLKSKLNNDILLQIWNLADTQDRGALDSTDFAIGMYFIQGLMSNHLSFVPKTLPPGLYQQAAGSQSGSVKSHMTGSGASSGSFSPSTSVFPNLTGLQPQLTGPSQQLLQPNYTGLPAAATPRPPPALPARSVSAPLSAAPFIPPRNGQLPAWDVTPVEKANSDMIFEELDTHKRGYIEGEVAVPLMLKSNLPGEDLARVWDLSDLNNDGKLTRDGLAVAMHLIQKKLAGVNIPATLPPSLVPPSMRADVSSPFSPASPIHQIAPEPVKDLLWDETPPNSAIPPPIPAQSTGQTLTLSSTSSPMQAFRAISDPFAVPAQLTGINRHHDLLGDDDDEGHVSPQLHDQSAEIGNLQNQVNSTTRSTEAMKMERITVEQNLANQASQLAALQTQLSSAKAACETETKLLATFKDRHAAQTAEIQKVREELIRAESDLSAVRVEKAEIEGAFLRDKEDARELHRKMIEAGQQAEILKAEVEKLKKDAKQQKGLLAIAKKQLSSKETEKAKMDKELEETKAEVASVNKEIEETEAATSALAITTPAPTTSTDSLAFAAAQPLPVSPDPSSSSGSVKSNNPFERLSRAPSTPSHSPFMPFAPTPAETTEAPVTDQASDPFGFAEPITAEPQSFDSIFSEHESSTPEETAQVPTPKPEPVEVKPVTEPESILSPGVEGENDLFVTPPTSANGSLTPSPVPHASMSPPTNFPALDELVTKFPDIQAEGAKTNGSLPVPKKEEPEETETDLTAPLKELEVEESDSDSDSEDEVPLAQLAKPKTGDEHRPPVSQDVDLPQPDTTEASFDDVFGEMTPAATTNGNASSDTDLTPAPAAPEKTLFDQAFAPSLDLTPAPKSEPTVAGVNAFDEAMGTIPTSSTAAPAALTFDSAFDSAFDDNFDFSAAKVTFPPVLTGATTNGVNANGHPKDDGFGDLFSVPAPAKTETSTFIRPYEAAPVTTSNAKPSFDEAFGGLDARPSQEMDSSFASRTSTSTMSTNQTAFPTSQITTTTSPRSITPQNLTPHSPPPVRSRSPPPRVSSPKQRPSTSSSKEVPDKSKDKEKDKDIPPRHSKLSIRLPFGRKKKDKQQHEPLPSLAPAQEEARILSPAVEDDIDSVKQITAMGFTRSEAVAALEKYDYDVQRALNHLIGG